MASKLLERLQDQRARYSLQSQLVLFGQVLNAISKLATGEYDAGEFQKCCDLITDYAKHCQKYGFWDGAIQGHLKWLEHELDKAEAEQYADDAAAAAQQELLDPDQPDHPHDSRIEYLQECKPGHGTG